MRKTKETQNKVQSLEITADDLVVNVKLAEGAILPVRGTSSSAGLDLHALEAATLHPGRSAAISTGLYMEIPEGYYGAVVPRSGLAMRSQISIVNSPGTIDSDFRGEVKVLLENRGQEIFTVNPGDRIAQLIILQYPSVKLNVVDTLDDTQRSSDGFGSTGV